MRNPSPSVCAILAVLSLGTFVSAVSAQTFYEPVTYQYRSPSGSLYYYGGHDPQMIAWINSLDCRYVNQTTNVVRIPVSPTVRVFSDCLPFATAENRGYTPSDAANTANASVPLFFRAGDAVSPVRVASDGVTIPAYAQPVAPGTAGPATQPGGKGTILIIPKSMLRPTPPKSDAQVAAAN